jgi:hypothetical protein
MRLKPGLDTDFVKDQCDLALRCDLRLGWRRAPKRWRFGAWRYVHLPQDRLLRASVTVREETWKAQRTYSAGMASSQLAISESQLASRPAAGGAPVGGA